MASGVILAAPASGSGKTVLCAGLLAHFRERGRAVRAFKAGPDYIDPGYHRMASGHDCVNLDPWGMRPETLARRVAALCAGADLVIGEGAMGLFDGARDGTGSTADLAARLGLPVVLVVDARGQGASVAALAEGFAGHRADVTVAGVILNRVASAAHERLLRDALDARSIAVLGAVPRDEALSLPSRHLGLVQACESEGSWVDRAASVIARSVDTDALEALAHPLQATPTLPGAAIPPLGQRISVARDAAFGFCYDALMEDWRAAGAAVVPFSPLADEAPDELADAVYLPGGYPELHAGRIAGAHELSRRAARRGPGAALPCLANAGATWCWAGASPTPTASATPWPGCCRWRPVFRSAAFRSAIATRVWLRLAPSARRADQLSRPRIPLLPRRLRRGRPPTLRDPRCNRRIAWTRGHDPGHGLRLLHPPDRPGLRAGASP